MLLKYSITPAQKGFPTKKKATYPFVSESVFSCWLFGLGFPALDLLQTYLCRCMNLMHK